MALQSYVRLCRPPNVWTAFGDVAAGAAVACGVWPSPGRFAPVLAASALLYASGMAFNDVFDLERDRTLHPDRPLPSGAIRQGQAALMAVVLMASGVGLAFTGWWPGILALFLAGTILLYDSALSHTVAGPVSMGMCRFANVLLGASLAGPIEPVGYAAAGVVGVHTLAISLAARRETRPAARPALVAAWLPCVAAAGGLIVLAAVADGRPGPAAPFALAAVSWTGVRLIAALRRGTTPAVVGLVKTAILALPILDGGLVAAFYDWRWGVAVAALALPAWLMGRWFHMT